MRQNKEIVWESTLDKAWHCYVERTHTYHGRLRVQSVEFPDHELLNVDVTLAYGAAFGPDVDDVDLWADMSLKAVDAYVKSQQVTDEEEKKDGEQT